MLSDNSLQAHPPASENAKRVLIVEDNLMNRRLAEFVVKSKGLLYDACDSGSQALELLKEKRFDLVLMDIEMPGMNGYECTTKIRKELRLDIPVVAMTAHDSEEERSKCREAGMNGYISKPMDEKEFSSVLKQHTGA